MGCKALSMIRGVYGLVSEGDPVPNGEESRPNPESPDFGDEDDSTQRTDDGASIYSGDDPDGAIDFIRPFEHLADLPEDIAEAFESFKLAILRHKAGQWEDIALDDVLGWSIDDYRRELSGSAMKRAKLEMFQRNARIAQRNSERKDGG